MSSLHQLQAWMQRALMDGTAVLPTIEMHVLPSESLSAAQRLAIYQRGYYARLTACLEGQFRALKTALGEPLFRDFAREYLQEFPSQSATLADLGGQFVAFLERNRPDNASTEKESWIDFMIELARFEWDLYTVFDQKGSEDEPMAAANTPDEQLIPQRCLFLHRYAYPVNRYFAVVANGNEPDLPDAATVYIAFVRTNYVTRVFPLLAPQYHFLQGILAGKSIDAALETTQTAFNSTPERVREAWAEWRHNWIRNGFFIRKAGT